MGVPEGDIHLGIHGGRAGQDVHSAQLSTPGWVCVVGGDARLLDLRAQRTCGHLLALGHEHSRQPCILLHLQQQRGAARKRAHLVVCVCWCWWRGGAETWDNQLQRACVCSCHPASDRVLHTL
jgi:hypothetical protein